MRTKRKTLLLVNPANQLRPGFQINRVTRNQPLSLGIIAALTPQDWKIKIIDENFREFRYYEADLVGLTAFTSTAPRAYEIASVYREKGIPTVMGGIHASMLPEESMQYVDAIVQGEAELVWPQLVGDFEAGKMQRLYVGQYEKVIRQPKPRRDLFHPGYICAAIQTTRGCPLNCTFCSVSAFNGKHYRFRPVDEVLDELEEIPQSYVFFIDDNIVGYTRESKERTKLLLEGILRRGIKKHWICQASVNIAEEKEILELAGRTGCRMMFLGIESETEELLKEGNKHLNIRLGTGGYEKVFRSIHRHGIGIIAGLIFGWDGETPKTIRDRVKFTRRCSADSFQTSVLTPLPGTPLFEKVKSENRLLYTNFPADWTKYDYLEPTIRHPVLSNEQLDKEIVKALRKIFSPPRILLRHVKTLIRTRNFWATLTLSLNYWHYRNIFLKGRYPVPPLQGKGKGRSLKNQP